MEIRVENCNKCGTQKLVTSDDRDNYCGQCEEFKLNHTMNENQLKVFDELLTYVEHENFNSFKAVYWLLVKIVNFPDSDLKSAYVQLSNTELNDVLSAFTEWVAES